VVGVGTALRLLTRNESVMIRQLARRNRIFVRGFFLVPEPVLLACKSTTELNGGLEESRFEICT
jgi:hypothetical protein